MCTGPTKFATRAPSCHRPARAIRPLIRAVAVSVCRSRTVADHGFVGKSAHPVTAIQCGGMVDLTEIEALRASLRGARESAAALADVASRVEATDPHQDVGDAELDDLQRLTLANAVAAQALRGFVESMLKRRGKLAA